MDDHRIPEPFHAGELMAQRLAGGGPAGAPIRSRMPEQHRQFFPLLPFLCVAVADDNGWPLATLVHGEPGFVSSPDPGRLRIAALPDQDDPAGPYLSGGAQIGMLGIDLATRRRNRANGRVARVEGGSVVVDIDQSFGNCPKYIHVRQLLPVTRRPGPVETFGPELPRDAAALIAACQTMFVATSSGDAGGLDMSHRGGEAGFLLLHGDVLTVPDYAGNRYFNTLGNLLREPRASLLLVDFERGDILQLQGLVKLLWREDALPGDARAQRAWEFRIVRGWMRRGALPLGDASSQS
ncbi:pyridoxamine 5'-phosphate oxidase family protein [Massilia sp. DD77]|uniref:pyridoxamine 5'-phosphate oxidase family protein n=1 Tax=Massilia sp. DD77 TaxID=3109349 RepID=UPI002FFF3BD8